MFGMVVGTQRTMEKTLSKVCVLSAKERVKIW